MSKRDHTVASYALVATLGTSPQVITETLDKLLFDETVKIGIPKETSKINFTDIVIVHTKAQPVLVKFPALLENFVDKEGRNLKPGKSVYEPCFYEWRDMDEKLYRHGPLALKLVNIGADDVDSVETNDHMRDVLFGEIFRLKSEGKRIIVSLAGGRKTMSAYALLASQVFGVESVVHVLVPEEIERSGEYHPPMDVYKLVDVPFIDLSRPLNMLREKVGESIAAEFGGDEKLKHIFWLLSDLAQMGIRSMEPPEAEEFHGIVYKSRLMREVVNKARIYARTDEPILITGETGVGKNVLAKAIHLESLRSKNKFDVCAIGAASEQLVDSELFGHVKGAFTDAREDRPGLFKICRGGTVFLDEIGVASPNIQVKLLRVLRERKFKPLGSDREEDADCRVIAATNEDIDTIIQRKVFREDLYYRFRVVIEIPPLRDRREDIPCLAHHLVKERCRKMNRNVELTDEAIKVLCGYDWPGNVGELENVIFQIVTETAGRSISGETVSRIMAGGSRKRSVPMTSTGGSLKESRKEKDRQLILNALKKCNWNKKAAAEELGISITTLRRYRKKYGLF